MLEPGGRADHIGGSHGRRSDGEHSRPNFTLSFLELQATAEHETTSIRTRRSSGRDLSGRTAAPPPENSPADEVSFSQPFELVLKALEADLGLAPVEKCVQNMIS